MIKIDQALFFFILPYLLLKCEKQFDSEILNDAELFHSAVENLTDVSVYDIFSPPVAARVYVYPIVAAYEIMVLKYPKEYRSLKGQIKGLGAIPKTSTENIDHHLAALFAFNTVGKALIFSEDKMDVFQENLKLKLSEHHLPRRVEKASQKYGNQVAEYILDWASKDMYNQTRTFPKYTIREESQFWKPTPPDYMDGIEPHWDKIRTLVLDSAAQFRPNPPLPFDLSKGSPFQKQLEEVYQIGKQLTKEQKAIAQFWDCNPYVSHHKGHVMFATKKITPGGHWMGITTIACRQARYNFHQAINAYANVAITLFDAFISCWDEKWETLVVRPETLINEYYDKDWMPLLQTPPFPEYTSGHSVISRAAAISLTNIFGDNFQFNDTIELKYNLPERKFNSFLEASEEAAISRLYGGIHYTMAIEEGVAQGQKVGEYIAEKVQTKISVPQKQ
ncbi:MAG: vanadium-dependent haloperoxidase [Flavobacteriaceae bacterium]|jgi:hypothetical protein